jgi:tetratricopeptide (TPR) repeat protein
MEEDPKLYHAIMVSSTFTDLEAHRREVIEAIHHFGFHANVMEYDGARADADVIESSLRFVRDSAAYVALIGHKYGQTPHDPARNPDRLSVTELEFNEARRLGRPILLFVMSDDHAVKKADVEQDPDKLAKLNAFREQAKRKDPVSEATRIYESFESKEDLATKAAIAIGRLAQLLKESPPAPARATDDAANEKLEAILATLGKLTIPDRAVREAIARFIDIKPEATEAELVQSVERFESDYRALQAQLAAITLVDHRVTSLKADAEAALAAGDLDRARADYRHASDAARAKAAEPVRTTARLIAAEASAHLLALDWAAADTAWAEAAAMLAPFDRRDAEKISEDAADRLETHGDVHALAGAIAAAIIRKRALVEAARVRIDQTDAARLQNNLGNTLQTQGRRTGGSEGLRLLDEAIAAYRDALTVYTRDDMPTGWAITQNNLGNALQIQGERTDGDEGLRLLDEAAAAYRDALAVHTRNDLPSDWAMTQNNLGIVVQNQGERTAGDEGLRLLDEAIIVYGEVLTVYTRDDMPDGWAATQNNLGSALFARGERTDGAEGLRLLDEAVSAYRNALTVRTRNDMPAKWAMTQNNLGGALHAQGKRASGTNGLHILEEAVGAYRDALTVRTRDDMPADWAMTQENLGLTHESIAEADPDRAHAHFTDAEAAFVAALTVYTPEHMSYDYRTATRSLARVREKLAALDR